MKNKISATFFLVLLVVVGLGSLQFLPDIQVQETSLRKVDLLADIRLDEPEPDLEILADSDTLALPALPPSLPPSISPAEKPVFIDSCQAGMECIQDYADSTHHGMKAFYEALENIDSMNRPVRIAYFGDSFIEGDILTADLREKFQEKYGGSGVGYVPITSNVAGFRPTVIHRFSNWKSHCVTDSVGFNRLYQGIANRYFNAAANASITLVGEDKYASYLDTCDVSTFYLLTPDSIRVVAKVNGSDIKEFSFRGDSTLQALTVEGRIGKVTWMVRTSTPSSFYYAATMDPHRGVVVDNFSTRGSSGQQIGSIPLSMLKKHNELRPYDLIVLHYGLNVAFKQGVNYTYYKNGMTPVIEKLQRAFPSASILVVGIGDREYKDKHGNLRTIPGVKNLIKYQQALAAENHVGFWNLYRAMGGEGSIVDMVNAQPPMANFDYTHINFRGGKHIAELLFDALMHGKDQYDKRKAYEMQ